MDREIELKEAKEKALQGGDISLYVEAVLSYKGPIDVQSFLDQTPNKGAIK